MAEGMLALLIETRTENNAWGEPHFEMKLRAVRFIQHEDAVRSVDTYDEAGLDNLQLRVSGSQWKGEPRKVYGDYHLEYENCYCVSIQRVEAMAKVVKQTLARYRKHTQEYGYPQSFGAYCAIMAKALGITCVLDQKPRGEHFPEGRRYRSMNPGEAISCIDSKARAWIAEGEAVLA